MCIGNKILKQATTEIKGHKVVAKEKGKLYSLFLSVDGKTTLRGKIKHLIPIGTEILAKDFNLKTGKEKGRGFSFFLTKEEAQLYLSLLKNDGEKAKDKYRLPLTIVECVVPKNSLYYKGTINKGYVGEGLSAFASQKIIFSRKGL